MGEYSKHLGIRISTHNPCGTSALASTAPRCASTIDLTTASPRPVPPALVVKKRFKYFFF